MTAIKGKNILITGGSRGIGPLIAVALAKRGGHIILTARSEEKLQAVNLRIREYDPESIIIPADLSKIKECDRLISKIKKYVDRIDILINNAGVETEGSYLSLSWEEISKTIEVNLISSMYLAYLFLPNMISNQSGHIVSISSTGGKCGAPYAATYCATKAGIAEWSQAMRLELERTGVQISTIFPGYITEVGMFAKFGLSAPKTIGCCTPNQVVNAVIKAIESNSLEIIVNSIPIQLLLALKELSPGVGDRLMHLLGVVSFQKRKVGL